MTMDRLRLRKPLRANAPGYGDDGNRARASRLRRQLRAFGVRWSSGDCGCRSGLLGVQAGADSDGPDGKRIPGNDGAGSRQRQDGPLRRADLDVLRRSQDALPGSVAPGRRAGRRLSRDDRGGEWAVPDDVRVRRGREVITKPVSMAFPSSPLQSVSATIIAL